MRKLFLFSAALVGAAICAAGFYYGRNIPFAQQWPLYEALRNTAAIIFAVVGAWLAIIYPERLKLSFGKADGGAKPNGNMGLLLTPAIHSTIILVSLLLIGILVPILKQIPFLLAHLDNCRGISFFILSGLTLWQVVIVIMTIIPADMVKTMADTESAKNEIVAHYSKLIKK